MLKQPSSYILGVLCVFSLKTIHFGRNVLQKHQSLVVLTVLMYIGIISTESGSNEFQLAL